MMPNKLSSQGYLPPLIVRCTASCAIVKLEWMARNAKMLVTGNGNALRDAQKIAKIKIEMIVIAAIKVV